MKVDFVHGIYYSFKLPNRFLFDRINAIDLMQSTFPIELLLIFKSPTTAIAENSHSHSIVNNYLLLEKNVLTYLSLQKEHKNIRTIVTQEIVIYSIPCYADIKITLRA